MKKTNWLAFMTCVCLLASPVLEAQAKRLGSGGNIGRVTPGPAAKPQAIPAKPAAPQAAPQGQQAAKPAAATPAQTPKKNSWLGPIAGIAAGLGLAALASYLGLGEELMSLMLIVLAAVVLFALFRWFAARRAPAGAYPQPAMAKSGYGNADLGPEGRPSDSGWNLPASGGQQLASSQAEGPQDVAVPQQEIDQFLQVAREQFTKLQSVWDSGDVHTLAEFCTSEMNRELSHQIADRKGASNVTQVVSLKSEWMGMTESTDDFGKPVDEVRVRFSGMIREAADAPAVDFDEVWTLQRLKGGDTGWLLAGIMQFGD